MPMSLEEITAREEDLRQEIAEREHLLAAYQHIRAGREQSLASVEPAPPEVEPAAEEAPTPFPSGATVPVLPEINLELQALSRGWAGTGRAVSWVLQRITGTFTVRDIAAVLEGEGCPIPVEKLSVIVNRMKFHQITELRNGRGRTPSLFQVGGIPPVVPADCS
jgi:hypothetical protein